MLIRFILALWALELLALKVSQFSVSISSWISISFSSLITICFDWLNFLSDRLGVGTVFKGLIWLVDLILTGLFLYLRLGSYLMLKSPANCWMSSWAVYWIRLGLRLTIDLRLVSFMMILLVVGRFWLDLAEVARLKKVFLLLDVDFCEILEELLICDFLRDLFERWVILEFISDLLDS